MIKDLFYLLLMYVRTNHYSIVKKLHYFTLIAFPIWVSFNIYDFYKGGEITFYFVFFFFLNLYLIMKNNKLFKNKRGDYE